MKLDNTQIKISLAGLSFIFFVGLGSCKKLIAIPDPKGQLSTSAVFKDSLDATSAILRMYLIAMNSASAISVPFNGQTTLYTGLSADELSLMSSVSAGDVQFYINAINAQTTTSIFWTADYPMLYQANACIEGLTASTTISDLTKNQLLGEAKFMRAFCFFNLVNIYGGIPLTISTDYKINTTLPRSSPDDVYKQITADLISAQSLLSETYPSSGRVRPNKYTALALLAKVYLYRKMWPEAENTATQIINSNIYSLVPVLNNVYLAGSNEAIWQMLPGLTGYETPEGGSFVPVTATTKPKYIISPFLLNAFEVGDQRRTNWINTVVISGQTYNYPYKYKLGRDNNTTPKENYMVFRLGEQYLIRAEARAQQGTDLTGAVADLNIIRNRAGLSNTTATTQSTILSAIYHERQVELFCEWGNRWFDLKRTGLVDATMAVVTPAKGGAWNSNWALYPLPYAQINANPALVQNPGY